MAPFLAVYGHVALDHVVRVDDLPGPDSTVPARGFTVRLGGTGANIARAAARLGVPVALASFVGDDFAHEHWEALEGAGVELSQLRRVPGRTPRVWILSVPGGPQATLIAEGVMAEDAARPPLEHAGLEAEWFHFTTGTPRDWLGAAAAAHGRGKRIAFDPAQETSFRYTADLLQDFLRLSRVFFANEAELERTLALLGRRGPQELLEDVDRVVVTHGARGLTMWDGTGRHLVPAHPLNVPGPVDATGAGDALRAGLYAGLHRGWDWMRALRGGAVAASLALEGGGARFPDEATWLQRLETWRD